MFFMNLIAGGVKNPTGNTAVLPTPKDILLIVQLPFLLIELTAATTITTTTLT